ncbi:MAG TPA: complex I NDUFA9 subunit family protein [Alphaproteobacteria bacterium]|nr:complex I NDUFA9 subunit family protein [Alphaproteobacteria bacterium]
MATRRVTIFGGSGFLGRHLVRRLAQRGDVVRVAVRDPVAANYLKPMGDVGQIVLIKADLRDEAAVRVAVEGADAVVNLVGILYERGAASFEAIHVAGAERVARAAAAAGATQLVHVSALGADLNSPARYGRTKAAGEAAVGAAFRRAAVMRPSVMFGPEDQFFNRFAALARLSPVLPVFGAAFGYDHVPGKGEPISLCRTGGVKFQPVYVGDVAEAIARALDTQASAGGAYELGGPQIMSFEDILRLVLRETGRRCILMPMPLWLGEIEGAILGSIPLIAPPLTRDQVRLMRRDNVTTPRAFGFAELGIVPTAAEAIVPGYMDIYRRGGRYRNPRLA